MYKLLYYEQFIQVERGTLHGDAAWLHGSSCCGLTTWTMGQISMKLSFISRTFCTTS